MAEEKPDRPTWLDDDFLRTCIKKSNSLNNDSNIQINAVEMSYVVAKGENYASVMYRVIVTYQLEKGMVTTEPFIVKVSHDMPEMAEASRMMCDVEIDMYVNILAEYNRLYAEKGVNRQLACRYLHAIDEPKVIVFEDLKPLGFVMADKYIGTDMEHTKAAFSVMAQYHAAGICYFYSQPEEIIAKYAKSAFEVALGGKMSPLKDGQIANTRSNIKELEKYNNKYNKAIGFLEKYIDLLEIKNFPMTPTIPGSKFNAMIHTDLHINNVMFRYKQDGTFDDMILVDFQTCFYTSVSFDFLFFFITSTSLEVRTKHYKDIKKFYFESLVNNLKLLEYKGDLPTFHEFEEDLKRHAMTAMFATMFMLKNVVRKIDPKMKSREKTEAFTMEDMRKLMAQQDEDRNYLDKMVAIVDILQNDGFLDKPPIQLCK